MPSHRKQLFHVALTADVKVTDLGLLRDWVIDQIKDDGNLSFEPGWQSEDGEEPHDVILSESVVYDADDPQSLLTVAARFLPGTLPGLEVQGNDWDVR